MIVSVQTHTAMLTKGKLTCKTAAHILSSVIAVWKLLEEQQYMPAADCKHFFDGHAQ